MPPPSDRFAGIDWRQVVIASARECRDAECGDAECRGANRPSRRDGVMRSASGF
jgi:hypothetical protein